MITLTQQYWSSCGGCLQLCVTQHLCSLIHSSSACGITAGRRRLLTAQNQRRCIFIDRFSFHVHCCDVAAASLSIFLHGWHKNKKISQMVERERERDRDRGRERDLAAQALNWGKVWRSRISIDDAEFSPGAHCLSHHPHTSGYFMCVMDTHHPMYVFHEGQRNGCAVHLSRRMRRAAAQLSAQICCGRLWQWRQYTAHTVHTCHTVYWTLELKN